MIVWTIRKISRPSAILGGAKVEEKKESSMFATETKKGASVIPDVGRDTYRLAAPNNKEPYLLAKTPIPVAMDLPAPYPPIGILNSPVEAPLEEQLLWDQQKQKVLNTEDVNIDPRIQYQWALHEIPYVAVLWHP